MSRFVQGEDRRQDYLLPASLDDYVSADNPVRAVEAFIDALDLKALEFAGMTPAETGRPAYHPATMLKIYLIVLRPLDCCTRPVGHVYRRFLPEAADAITELVVRDHAGIEDGRP